MPDSVISALPQELLASQAAADDLLPIVDVSSTTTKKIKISSVRSHPLTDLSDVSGTPNSGDVLVYSGTAWVATDLSTLADEILPSLTGNAGDVLAVNSSATGVEWVAALSFPSYAGNAGEILSVNVTEDGVEWVAQYPSFSTNNGKYLRVNSAGNGVEWSSPLPALTGNANRYLKVTSDASAVEWSTDTLATYPSLTGNAGKVLTVNSGASGVEWVTISGGGSSTWGSITGTLADQSDLNSALNSKLDAFDIGTTVLAYDANVAYEDTANVFTEKNQFEQTTCGFTALTFATSLSPNLANGQAHYVTATGNATLNQPTGEDGSNFQSWQLEWIQDATGGRTLGFNTTYYEASGATFPTVTATANRKTVLFFNRQSNGKYLVTASLDVRST